jgi:hypothetical protein
LGLGKRDDQTCFACLLTFEFGVTSERHQRSGGGRLKPATKIEEESWSDAVTKLSLDRVTASANQVAVPERGK